MASIFKRLYFWVAVFIAIGAAWGALAPDSATSLKPIADGFISLVKMLIGPLIFCTVVLGLAGAGGMKKAGRVGAKALLYFEALSTLALVAGLAVGNWLKPGAGFGASAASLDATAVAGFEQAARASGGADLFLHLIPKTFFDAFTGGGDLIQVLVVALLFGWGLSSIGDRAEPIRAFIEATSHAFFAMMGAVMKLAPLGAGAAMAFTVGKFGLSALQPLAYFMACFYLACVAFVAIALGAVGWACGFNVFRFVFYVRRELLLVLGTSSSESALAPLMEKLRRLGCSPSTVGLVVPAGYSFNLDGTNVYLSMATLFVAQALGIELSLREQLAILAVAMLTSKGASGVTGAGFIALAATLAAVPTVPVAGLSLIVGVDRFMSEARALTNLIGNGVAALAIARWEGELDVEKLRAELKRPVDAQRWRPT